MMCPEGYGPESGWFCQAIASMGFFPLGEPAALMFWVILIYFSAIALVSALFALATRSCCGVPFVLTFCVGFTVIANGLSCYDNPGCSGRFLMT